MFTNLVVVRCIVVIKVIKHTSRLVLCHLINMSQNVRAIESEAELHAFVFKHEFTMVVAGPSRSGKTEFVKALVPHKDRVIHPPPTKVVWCYREWQKAYEDMRDVKFVKEIPQDDESVVFRYVGTTPVSIRRHDGFRRRHRRLVYSQSPSSQHQRGIHYSERIRSRCASSHHQPELSLHGVIQKP